MFDWLKWRLFAAGFWGHLRPGAGGFTCSDALHPVGRLLLGLSLLVLAAGAGLAQDSLIITEFMASNSKTLLDEDGDSSDWIEIHNAGTNAVGLDGWYLTDSAGLLARWRFPNAVLAPKGYRIVFASGKDRTNAASTLHANFQLAAGGEFLALVRPDGVTVASQFAPKFPTQQTDISYGRDRVSPELLGYFLTPTPGAANSTGGPGFAGSIQFSRPGGTFNGAFSLALSNTASAPNAVIRYTLNGAPPTETSPAYSSPIAISGARQVRARVFQPGLWPGPMASESYLALDPALAEFTSDLPMVVLHNFNGGTPPADPLQFAALAVFEPKGGRSSMTNAPDVRTRAGCKRRGNSTLNFPKSSFTVETWDEFDEDKTISLLGLPADSDWVLYAPNRLEPVLIHNPLMYELSNEIGRWAPRVRLVEVYVNTSGGPITSADYNGVYVLAEKVTRGPQRVDIEKLEPQHLNPPELTGGYLLKQDRPEADGVSFQLPSSGGVPGAENPANLLEPDPRQVTAEQEAFIRGCLTDFVNLFSDAAYANPVNEYPQFIDVDSWIDIHLLSTLSLDPDAFRFSSYFYKPRLGKIVMGPIWDFDRALGSTDPRSWNPRTWRADDGGALGTDMFNYHWWKPLFRDLEFFQKWIDRWQELRHGPFATNNVFALVDGFAAQLREAQAREVARWPSFTQPRAGQVNGPGGYQYDFGNRGYQAEVDFLKQWLNDRIEFIDTNFVAAPRFSQDGGPIQSGFTLLISGPPGSIHYTLDGTDPRLPGGGLSPRALNYAGPVTLTENARVVARARDLNHTSLTGPKQPPLSSPWSGPVAATFVVSPPPLVITEIMYHPHGPPSGITNGADDFEFIELKNIGLTSLNLNGVRLTKGIGFNFTGSSVTNLDPGQRVLIVRNRAAFLSRYPGVSNIAGEYAGSLDNDGESLCLEGPLREPILDFAYKDRWQPATDGLGFSLVIVNENAPLDSWGEPGAWRPSSTPGGSPGQDDPAPPSYARVLVNEALTHTDPPLIDSIELFNPGPTEADISGWFLSDDLNEPKKFRIRDGTIMPPGGFQLFTGSDFGVSDGNNEAFSLGSQGDEVYLFSGDAGTNLTGYAHGFKFGAAANGVSFGRHVTSTGEEHFVAQSARTPGASNALPRVGPVVVSEIMYHPPDLRGGIDNQEDEFVELLNVTAASVPLFDPAFPTNTWRLRDAVDFVFPPNVALPAGGCLIVVSFDPGCLPALNAFRARYDIASTVPVFGPYLGKLDNSADNVELAMPDSPEPGKVPYVLVDKVDFRDAPPWSLLADGAGWSLQRRGTGSYGNDPANWMADLPTPGSANVSNTPPTRALTVESSNPTNGVTITSSPNDINGWGAGNTAFVCNYADGTVVTLTAPSGAGGNEFVKWQRDGIDLTSNRVATVLMDADHRLTALFAPPVAPTSRSLMVTSTNPISGVTIAASPADANSLVGEVTPFPRVYTNGTIVSLVAPASVGGNAFVMWLQDGVASTTNTTLTATMNADHIVTAVYTSPANHGGPVPVVRLAFDETNGLTTANSGTAGGALMLTEPWPERTVAVPAIVGGLRAIDMGGSSGDYGVDSAGPIPALGGLSKFTITGWVNNRDIAQGSGGNRIVTWLGPDLSGVELVYRGDGSLILSVNEEPTTARSSAGMIPADLAASPANWRYFAVTYDATAGQVQFYFGFNGEDAVLDKAVDYPGRGAVGPTSGRLTVGHLNPERRTGRENRIFRGMIDDVQIFDKVLLPSEILAVQRGMSSPAPPPAASFTSALTNGTAPLTVTFADSSTGSITNRFWDFGNGITTNTLATNVTCVYNAAGTNTVSLTVSGPGGSNTLIRTAYITATHATAHLVAHISRVSPETGQIRLQVSGLAGQGFRILASTNLQHWIPIRTNTVPFDGTFEFIDAVRVEVPARFYRVITP